MMMISQCSTFGSLSKAFWDHWELDVPLSSDSVGKSPATVSNCDWRETQDMIDFQAFVGHIKIRDDLPDVTATGIPLSVILVAHHNLVTYGVPFVNNDGQWTNPGPKKTYYTPREAIVALAARLESMSNNDGIVKGWLSTNPNLDVTDGPGMQAWAEMAKREFTEPRKMQAKKAWEQFHEVNSDEDNTS